MKALTPGHNYELLHFENPIGAEHIQFIQKEKKGDELVTIKDGTTNEEVLEMLIDRMKFLNKLMPSHYNDSAIDSLIAALGALNRRTTDRKRRGVEGTRNP